MSTARDVRHGPFERALKIATRDLIEAVGGVGPAAEFAGCCVASISNYQGVNTDSFAPLHVIFRLLEVAGPDPRAQRIVSMLAARAGMVAIERPRGDWSSADYMAQTGEMMRGAGAFSGDMILAHADRDLDAGERGSLSTQSRELAAVLLGMADALERGL